jgi:hypothetical protein
VSVDPAADAQEYAPVSVEAPVWMEVVGRIWSTQMLVVMGGPRLGDVESTAAAAAVGAPFSLLSGGLLCLAGVALIARRLPQLARYDAWHDPTANPSGPA